MSVSLVTRPRFTVPARHRGTVTVVVRDDLNDAVKLLDAAIAHAERWPPGRSSEWSAKQFGRAHESIEQAVRLMEQAEQNVMAARPGGVFRTVRGRPARPYLERALSFAHQARLIVDRLREQGGPHRDELGRASHAIGEACDIMAAVARIRPMPPASG